ncbi:hypothetical protein ACTA71_009783 [Dictyostelium dimigraforme]
MSSNNNNNNNNNNNDINNNINDENLPENKKTKKRLLEVIEDESTPITGEDEVDEDDLEITKEDTKGSEKRTPLTSTTTKSSSTTTTTNTTTNAHTEQSPLQGSNSANTFNKTNGRVDTILSPKLMGGIAIQPLRSGEEDSQDYFGGRRLVATSDSGSSDMSDSESKKRLKDNQGIMIDSSSINHHQKKKKRKTRRREGRIYELLEKNLGSQALREGLIGTQFISFDWPYELVLVRHGQSEGNEAQARSKRGDLSAYTEEFKKKHSSVYRLTDKGVLQAKIAGKWVRENISEVFDRYYTSEYVRAMETASLLGLPDANWLTEIQLRERDKGKMDNISWTDKKDHFGNEMMMRKRDSFFWCPPGGESIANICQRVEHTFITLRRECSNKRVIIVAHGEIMWAFRVRLERLSQLRFHQLQSSDDPRDQIHNTTILHYSRIHPKTGQIYPYFRYLRSVCPWRPEYSAPGWAEFERPIYTNEEMLESVRSVPRYVNNQDFDLEKEEILFDVSDKKSSAPIQQ